MNIKKKAAPKSNGLQNSQNKYRAFTLDFIRIEVEKESGIPFLVLKAEYSELRRYKLALNCITTTNKAICEAMNIPVEAGTKYKRRLEKAGLLVSSIDLFRCPFTQDLAHLLSTNPREFERLQKSKDTQLILKIWEDEK